jgi:hypothetical protein
MGFNEIWIQGDCFIAVLPMLMMYVGESTFIASGKEANLIYAAARFAYPLGSSGALLIASVYAFTAPG